MIYAATGHRPDKLDGYTRGVSIRLIVLAQRQFDRVRPEKVISGMALGWDQAVAVAAYIMGIPFTAAVPFVGQEKRWPDHSQKIYHEILAQAEDIHITSDVPCIAALHARNEWMVDNTDEMLALWNGSPGGTANCVEYARKRNVPIINLWPQWWLRDLLG